MEVCVSFKIHPLLIAGTNFSKNTSIKTITMKKVLYISIALLIVMTSLFCKSKSKATKNTMVTDAGQSPKSSMNWDGIYRGVLPCADCDGIQKTVYLIRDGNFLVRVKYLGRQDSSEISGTFSWNDQGNMITLNDIEPRTSFLVGENTLTQLDTNGNKITGETAGKFILSKERYAILFRFWRLTELFGKRVIWDSGFVEHPHIIFQDEGNIAVGNLACNRFRGPFQLSERNRISISQPITTRMGCPRMDVETQFLNALTTADNFETVADMLILKKGNTQLAMFKTFFHKSGQ
jgi:copper homeostasis protein (lipoprotein)